MISPATIATIRRLEAEATPGEWHVSRLIGDGNHVAYGDALIAADEYGVAYCDSDAGNDAQFVAELRNAAGALCDAAEENAKLRERVAELEAACGPVVEHWRRIKRLMGGRAPAELQVEGSDLARIDAALASATPQVKT